MIFCVSEYAQPCNKKMPCFQCLVEMMVTVTWADILPTSNFIGRLI